MSRVDPYIKRCLAGLKACKTEEDKVGVIEKIYTDGFSDGANSK